MNRQYHKHSIEIDFTAFDSPRSTEICYVFGIQRIDAVYSSDADKPQIIKI